jgi:MFS family permease
LGSSVVGGIGLGLGYISPVSTLVKWFPDRRGMATGMAIMGFGGGAMIGAPLADILMNEFRTPDSVGVWQTFVALAAIYLVFMLGGALGYKLPPAGWQPDGWKAPHAGAYTRHVHLRDAHKTQQFWLIWAVLCLNVSAGIGVIGMRHRCCKKSSAVRSSVIQISALPNSATNSVAWQQRSPRGLLAFSRSSISADESSGHPGQTIWAARPGTTLFSCLALPFMQPRRRWPMRATDHPIDVRRRLRNGTRLSRRCLGHPICRRDPWQTADRLVRGRHRWPGRGELHPRV